MPQKSLVETVPAQAQCEEGVVVWPDGSRVVPDGVEGTFVGGERPDSPARVGRGAGERVSDGGRPIVRNGVRPEQVALVGGQHPAGTLLAVEGHRIEASVGEPETLEALRDAGCARLQLSRSGGIAVELEEASQAPLGGERVPLCLNECDWSAQREAVLIDDAVPGVLPALILETGGRTAAVLQQLIAVEVSELVDPAQRFLNLWPQLSKQLQGAAPVGVLAQQAEKQGGGVNRAVVPRQRRQLPVGELAHAAAHAAPCPAPRRARHRPSSPAVRRAVAGSPRPSLDRTRAPGARR